MSKSFLLLIGRTAIWLKHLMRTWELFGFLPAVS